MQDNNKKNSAVEKAEAIANGKEWKQSEHTSAVKETNDIKKPTKKSNKKTNQEKLKKEEKNRDRRIRLAEIRAERKTQKEKLKAEKIAEKEKRKAEIKKMRIKKAEEKQKRKEMLKKESKEQREKRILQERAAKLNAKKEMRKAKQQAKLERQRQKQLAYNEKQRIKKEKREQKAKERRERRKDRKGYGGWLAAVISLGCAVVILLGGVAYMFFNGSPVVANGNQMMSRAYEQNFYDLVGYVDSMDANLSKIAVSNDDGNRQKLLNELNVQSNLAVADITGLPLEDESRYYTTKILNQVGDFAAYLSSKLIDGGKVTSDDMQTITEMQKIVSEIKMSLEELSAKLGNGYSFMSMVDKKSDDLVISELKDIENMAINYPEMIYDGPFSDGLETREAKGLIGKKEISQDEAKTKLEKYFDKYAIEDIVYVGDTQNGNIQSYNFEAKNKDGVGLYAQITKRGGYLNMFNFYKTCDKTNFDLDACLEIAQEFLNEIGMENMKAVWYNEDGREVTINFAYEIDDVIYYSDLIKINVCQERGIVKGMVANNYILNHTKRNAVEEQITESEALGALSQDIDVENVRLAVVPVGNGDEKLCYEISGTYDGSTYFIYIDAVTGREVNIFKVVKTTEGTLLV